MSVLNASLSTVTATTSPAGLPVGKETAQQQDMLA